MGKAPGRHGLRMLPSVDPVYSVAKGVFTPWLRWGLRWTIEGAHRVPVFGPVFAGQNKPIKDGLAPGQVRRGLQLLPRVLDAMDGFCRLMGAEIYLVEPLFYHSAVLYERQGCGYLLGREVMDAIHAGFAVGGPLASALDGSSPLRSPEASATPGSPS